MKPDEYKEKLKSDYGMNEMESRIHFWKELFEGRIRLNPDRSITIEVPDECS